MFNIKKQEKYKECFSNINHTLTQKNTKIELCDNLSTIFKNVAYGILGVDITCVKCKSKYKLDEIRICKNMYEKGVCICLDKICMKVFDTKKFVCDSCIIKNL